MSTEIAVVLGSGLDADGNATVVTRLRARAAAAFVAQQFCDLICSGSRPPHDEGKHGKTEASVMADIVDEEGISFDRIHLEDQSFDTFGNAIYTACRYLKHKEPGTLYVITSPFHMERSLFIFRNVLGPSWTVEGHEAPEWSGETRQAGAEAAMKRAQEFFTGITPGDLAACQKKLQEQIPAYKDREVTSCGK
jgi:vancomycin permeability regulator SanA